MRRVIGIEDLVLEVSTKKTQLIKAVEVDKIAQGGYVWSEGKRV